MNFKVSKSLQPVAHQLIPGGAHTYAKGDDQYPELAPGFIARGEGCHVWDVDGNEFIEYGMGLRSVTLGHANKRVVEAAYRQMLLGTNFTRPASLEIECAKEMLGLVDQADMVKFTKDGSTATTAALKLARAYTGRNMVAICAEHPFFSYNDWFIGTTPMTAGIPQWEMDNVVKFNYNKPATVQALFDQYPGQIACVMMEGIKDEDPVDDFLFKVQELCHANGALFIIDEMINGFRFHLGGAQKYFNLNPDLSTFGKALGNGFAISALVGKRDIMELGGITTDKERVFLLSTTHGAETHALAAAIETMHIYQEEPVIETMWKQGERLANGINKIIAELNLKDHFQVIGKPCNLVFATRDQNKQPSQAFRALFMQETIKQGLITPSLVISYAHSDKDVDQTVEGIAQALRVYRKALEDGVEEYLVGRPVKPVFRKFV